MIYRDQVKDSPNHREITATKCLGLNQLVRIEKRNSQCANQTENLQQVNYADLAVDILIIVIFIIAGLIAWWRRNHSAPTPPSAQSGGDGGLEMTRAISAPSTPLAQRIRAN